MTKPNEHPPEELENLQRVPERLREMVIEKRCSKCGLKKTGDNFHRSGQSKDGLHGHCRACRSAYTGKPETRARARRSYCVRRALRPELAAGQIRVALPEDNDLSSWDAEGVLRQMNDRYGNANLGFPGRIRGGKISAIALAREDMSVEDFAIEMGVSRQTISTWQKSGAPEKWRDSAYKAQIFLRKARDRFAIEGQEQKSFLLGDLCEKEGWNL